MLEWVLTLIVGALLSALLSIPINLWLMPKIQNFLAKQSDAKTEKRLRDLQSTLARIEQLPALSEFEAIVVRALMGLAALLVIIPTLMALGYVMIFEKPEEHLTLRQTTNDIILVLLVFLIFLFGVSMANILKKFYTERSLASRESVRKSIEELRQRLPKSS